MDILYSTKDLTEELLTKEGVTYVNVEPYKKQTITIEGPACIIIVYD